MGDILAQSAGRRELQTGESYSFNWIKY